MMDRADDAMRVSPSAATRARGQVMSLVAPRHCGEVGD